MKKNFLNIFTLSRSHSCLINDLTLLNTHCVRTSFPEVDSCNNLHFDVFLRVRFISSDILKIILSFTAIDSISYIESKLRFKNFSGETLYSLLWILYSEEEW